MAMENNSMYYIDKSIEALDKADRAFKEFWATYASIYDDWPYAVPFDLAEYSDLKSELAKIANHIDKIQSRLLLEKHRESNRASAQ